MSQFAPAGKLEGQSLVWVNGPLVEIDEMLTGPVPVFAKVAGRGELAVPTNCVGKPNFIGASETVAVTPVPSSGTVSGLPVPA